MTGASKVSKNQNLAGTLVALVDTFRFQELEPQLVFSPSLYTCHLMQVVVCMFYIGLLRFVCLSLLFRRLFGSIVFVCFLGSPDQPTQEINDCKLKSSKTVIAKNIYVQKLEAGCGSTHTKYEPVASRPT